MTRHYECGRPLPVGICAPWKATPRVCIRVHSRPDGLFVVSASIDQTLRVWGAATGQQLRILNGHTDNVEACAFSPDGRFIVSASVDKTLKVWDTATGEGSHTYEARIETVLACAFSQDECFIASAKGWTLRVWNASSGQTLHLLEGHTSWLNACAFSRMDASLSPPVMTRH